MVLLVTGEVKTCTPPLSLTGTAGCRSWRERQNFDSLHVRGKRRTPRRVLKKEVRRSVRR